MLDGIARDLTVPLRQCSPSLRYCSAFYGQTGEGMPLPDNITVDALVKILAVLPGGVTELSCHPTEAIDFARTYQSERLSELKTLCDPRVTSALDSMGIRLCSFHDVARQLPTS